MASNGSLQWGRILLSALLAAVIALLLIFVVLWIIGNTEIGDVFGLCPEEIVDCWDSGNLAEVLMCPFAWAIACVVKILIYALIVYFPLAVVISIILIKIMVHQRQLLHIIVTALVSIPIAFLLLVILRVVS